MGTIFDFADADVLGCDAILNRFYMAPQSSLQSQTFCMQRKKQSILNIYIKRRTRLKTRKAIIQRCQIAGIHLPGAARWVCSNRAFLLVK